MTILYHYCSSSTFTSIVSNRSIWLSSLTLSNDSMEGKLLVKVLKRLLEKDNLDARNYEEFHLALSIMEELSDGLGFCLSEEGDLLSQWRGYASDGNGFSIGFSKEYLEKLKHVPDFKGSPLKLYKVLYKPEEQEDAIIPIYRKIKDSTQLETLTYPRSVGLRTREDIMKEKKFKIKKLLSTVLKAIPKLFVLKGEAFSEEKEWRLISYLLKDEGKSLFRVYENRIVPYREFKLLSLSHEPIVSVKIGPKNITPEFVIQNFLKQYGFNNVDVKRSELSYR